jgi:tryptophan-rich sensory protein
MHHPTDPARDPQSHQRARRAKAAWAQATQRHGIQWVVWCFAPFVGSVLLTMAFALLLPWWSVPRTLVPGHGLVWQGLAVVVGVVAALQWRLRKEVPPSQARRVLAWLTTLGALMAWPVVTMGLLPTVNGARLTAERVTQVQLMQLTTSPQKGQREPYHWARIVPLDGGTPGSQGGQGGKARNGASSAGDVKAGRLLVSAADYAAWSQSGTNVLRITHSRGLLGARVVTDIQGVLP